MKTTLKTIADKYCNFKHADNFSVGGGLTGERFESNRHAHACNDAGKLTFGQATAMFKKATRLDIDVVKQVIEYAVPNMEWHHAGALPKAYGGGMKKTYFLNFSEICDLATNWDTYLEKLGLHKIAEKNDAEIKKVLEAKKLEFLQKNAKKIERISKLPAFFYMTKKEMNGKYGWFDSTYKTYNLTEFFSGWEFESEEKYQDFFKILA